MVSTRGQQKKCPGHPIPPRHVALGLIASSLWCLGCGELPRSCPRDRAGACLPTPRVERADAARSPALDAEPSIDGSASWLDGEVGQLGRAILVSIDGCGATYLREQLVYGSLPTFANLRRAGASTLNARADHDYTETLPNHTTILTGRPVRGGSGVPDDAYHGWTANYQVPPSTTLHNAGNPNLDYVASVFDVVHDHGRRTCMYAGKAKFSLFSNSYNASNGAPDRIGDDDGRNKLDRVVILEDTEALITTVEGDLLGGTCDLAFVHIADLDTVGHSAGWGSDAWLSRLGQVDQWIGRLSSAASANAATLPYALIVTADHGGFDSSHLDATDERDYTIPFFVVASGVPPRADLYALANGRRTDPGSDRPATAGPLHPVRNGDAANAAMTLMGLPPVPGSYFRGLLAPQ